MEQDNKNRDMSPEEMKAIGEIEIGPAKHEIFLNNHYKKILLGILVAGLGAGSTIAYFSNKHDKNMEAASIVVSSLKTDSLMTVGEASDISKLQVIESQYPSSPARATAQLIEALDMLKGAEPAAGISKLQAIADTQKDITLSSKAAAAIANYYTQNNKLEEAASAWTKLLSLPENAYTAFAYLSLGDLSKRKGDLVMARSYFTSAQEKCATSALIDGKDIEMRLMMLDVDAPTPVAPEPTPTTPAVTPDSDLTIPDLDISTEGGDDDTLPKLNI